MNIILCRNGHSFDADKGSYCPVCGEKMENYTQASSGIICPVCGTILPEEYVFCSHCGAAIPEYLHNNIKPDEQYQSIESEPEMSHSSVVSDNSTQISDNRNADFETDFTTLSEFLIDKKPVHSVYRIYDMNGQIVGKITKNDHLPAKYVLLQTAKTNHSQILHQIALTVYTVDHNQKRTRIIGYIYRNGTALSEHHFEDGERNTLLIMKLRMGNMIDPSGNRYCRWKSIGFNRTDLLDAQGNTMGTVFDVYKGVDRSKADGKKRYVAVSSQYKGKERLTAILLLIFTLFFTKD